MQLSPPPRSQTFYPPADALYPLNANSSFTPTPSAWHPPFSFLSLNLTRLGALSYPGVSDGKESACNAGDPGSIPGLGRSPGEGNGNPLQYSCLENPMDRGAWQGVDHGIAKSQTQRSEEHFHAGKASHPWNHTVFVTLFLAYFTLFFFLNRYFLLCFAVSITPWKGLFYKPLLFSEILL